MTQPAQVARWCGLDRLDDKLHGRWLRQMLCSRQDMTLLAHRGSCKTTCLAFAMAAMTMLYPCKNIIFLRKTDEDVTEVIRQVKLLLKTDALQYLSRCIYGRPIAVQRGDMFAVHTDCFAALRGCRQLLGIGTFGSLTGKHADIVITDDIVNLSDRLSPAERRRVRGVYQELHNICNPGGRFINTGTPWHPEDAISLMRNVYRFDHRRTGLLSPEKVAELKRVMTPSLFAANYELKHIASADALFGVRPAEGADPARLRDGVAHVDAAYQGEDFTALTCGRIAGGRAYLYGRIWRRPVTEVMDEIIAECDRLLCGPIYMETNSDKGYAARELRDKGAQVRTYHEHMNKSAKISTILLKWWPKVTLIEGCSPAWLDQILDYTEHAAHDDAPDSAASLLRVLERQSRPHNTI